MTDQSLKKTAPSIHHVRQNSTNHHALHIPTMHMLTTNFSFFHYSTCYLQTVLGQRQNMFRVHNYYLIIS
jgi:hypothetical protein